MINSSEYGYEILFEEDTKIVEKFVNNKASKESLKRISDEKKYTLVPQLFWGNFDKPSIVILGKNPSYSKDDEEDNNNEHIHTMLKENLDPKNHTNNNKIINLLTNSEDYEFYNSYVANWWRGIFGTKLSSCTMNDVAIFNLYGYYIKESPSSLFSSKKSKLAHISKEEYINYVKNAVNNSKMVFILWSSCVEIWKKLLDGFDGIKGKVYIVNLKCPQNRLLKEAVPYSVYESVFKKYFNEDLTLKN